MKEIYYISNNLDVGGSQKVLISIANEAIKHGYKVNIISLTNNLFLSNVLNKSENLNIITCTNNKTSKGLINRLIITYNLFKYLTLKKPKILHSHLWQIDILYLLIIRIFFDVKIIHTIHSPGSSYLKINKLDIINNYIEKKLLTLNNVTITVVSEEIKTVIKNILDFKGYCFLIPNGVFMPNEKLIKKKLIKKDKYNFIFPARFQESKGHRILLVAFKMLLDFSPVYNCDLFLIGTGLKENLSDFIKSLDLNKNVILLDPVCDIYEILSKSDFGVFPSLYEGHSIALCEMMAIGLPTIATNISSNNYITENGLGALLCDPGSSNSLFNSMKKLIDDIDYANILSFNAQSIIHSKFSEKIMFSEYEKIYNSI